VALFAIRSKKNIAIRDNEKNARVSLIRNSDIETGGMRRPSNQIV
jgi:hypothetical protein